MNFQEKLLEVSSELRARAAAFAYTTLDTARARADASGKHAEKLKHSFATLTLAGRELNRVAQRHASRFVKENSAIAKAAGKEVGTLARSTFASLTRGESPSKGRKPRITRGRKRASAKAA
jgi:hypothetical protein